MALIRVCVSYDRNLKLGTWALTDNRQGVKARFQLASEPERLISTPLRCIRGKREAPPDAVWFSPITASLDTWVTETTDFAGQMDIKIALQLNNCPQDLIALLKKW